MEWSFPAQLHYLLYSPTTPIAAIDQISCIAKDHGQQVRSSSWRQIQIQRMILSLTAAAAAAAEAADEGAGAADKAPVDNNGAAAADEAAQEQPKQKLLLKLQKLQKLQK